MFSAFMDSVKFTKRDRGRLCDLKILCIANYLHRWSPFLYRCLVLISIEYFYRLQ